MHCFYHESIEAVAICKNCNRGVCRDCATELPNGIACKNRCEAEVEAVNQLISRGKTSYQKTSSAYSRNGLIYLLIGLVFGVVGVNDLATRPSFGWFAVILAAVFIIAAVLNFSTSKKFGRVDPDKGA